MTSVQRGGDRSGRSQWYLTVSVCKGISQVASVEPHASPWPWYPPVWAPGTWASEKGAAGLAGTVPGFHS